MAQPTTKTEFGDYCLRELGGGVIEINVTNEQVDDRIDEAIQYFQLFHMDAVERLYLTHQITQDDIDNEYFLIEEPVMTVSSVVYGGSANDINFGSGAWQYKYDMFSSYGFSSGTSSSCKSLSGYVATMQHMSMLDKIMSNQPTIHYSMHTNKLRFEDNWENFKVGDYIVYEAFVMIDPVTYPNVWNDMWLKSYTTALIGRQWGNNLEKFQEIELPGGITLNGARLYDKYNELVKELKEEMELQYTLPPDFMVG